MKPPPVSPLDLGFSSLLSNSVPGNNPADGVNGQAPQISGGPAEEPVSGSEFQRLAAAGRWVELASGAEARMASDSGTALLEARLWWIISQARLGSVPSSMLAGPLDSVSKALSSLSDRERAEVALLFEQAAHVVGAPVSSPALGGVKPLVNEERSLRGGAVGKPNEKRPRRAWLVLAVLILVIGGSAVAYRQWMQWRAGEFALPLQAIAPTEKAELSPVGLERSAVPSGLGALAMELDRARPTQAQSPVPARADISGGSVSSSAPAPREQAQLDMRGPVEPNAVHESRMNPEKSRGLSGDDAILEDQTPEFREYAGGRYFEVLVSTKVMSSPSLRASTLAELNAGQRLEVEAKEGYWYKVRSMHGRVGYVLAQDLSPAR